MSTMADVPLEIRILKLTEEVGEVAEAFIGVRGLMSTAKLRSPLVAS